ncbi:MAG: sporulation protein YqfD [Clostridia bacterium]|nr:sporulation protein YqfD [Clostridia bacterium]
MRGVDRLLGWREIATWGEGAKKLTDYLLKENVPAEVFSDECETVVLVGVREAKKIRAYLTRNGIEARYGPLRGLPALFRSLIVRPGILIGLVTVVLLFLFARSRVWEVRITGDGKIDEDKVRAALREAGLRAGMRKKDVSGDMISSACLSNGGLFSSVNVSVSGVVANVEWIGRSDGHTPVSGESAGVNLIASCDGIVVSVEPSAGVAVVAAGQTVRKGDLLISGVTKGGTVRSAGTVLARVTSEFRVTAAKTEEIRTTVGRRPVSISIRMFGEELFSLGGGGDASAVVEWTLPGGVVLPFACRFGYVTKTVTETIELTETQTAEKAFRRLNWIIREALSEGELLKKEVTGTFDGTGYTAAAKTEYLINIAQPLAFDSRNEYNK